MGTLCFEEPTEEKYLRKHRMNIRSPKVSSLGFARDLRSKATPRQKHTPGTRRARNVCLCRGFALRRRIRTSPDDPYDKHKVPAGHIVTVAPGAGDTHEVRLVTHLPLLRLESGASFEPVWVPRCADHTWLPSGGYFLFLIRVWTFLT